MSRYTNLSAAKIRKIIRMKMAGHSKAQITKITGHAYETVTKVLNNTYSVPKPEVTEADINKNAEPLTLWTADADPLRDVLTSNMEAATKVRLATLLLDERRG